LLLLLLLPLLQRYTLLYGIKLKVAAIEQQWNHASVLLSSHTQHTSLLLLLLLLPQTPVMQQCSDNNRAKRRQWYQ
jgi:hypothetical protein